MTAYHVQYRSTNRDGDTEWADSCLVANPHPSASAAFAAIDTHLASDPAFTAQDYRVVQIPEPVPVARPTMWIHGGSYRRIPEGVVWECVHVFPHGHAVLVCDQELSVLAVEGSDRSKWQKASA